MTKAVSAALLSVSLVLAVSSPALTAPAVTAGMRTEGLSGFWVLDTAKSRWGQMQKPTSVMLEVFHHDNSIRYTGWVVYANEETREFTFEGVVGGKEYPVRRSYGNGMMSIISKYANQFQTEYKSDDGLFVETSRIALSKDGTMLTRHMSLQGPTGSRSWVEIYRRR
jgi:hypothetical protein